MGDTKSIGSLDVYRAQVKAGMLKRTAAGCVFVFDPSFLADPKWTGLSFSMPKRSSPYRIQGVNLHPFFAGLLPEGLRLKSILRHLKTSPDDLFTLFTAVSAATIGDVYARSDELKITKRDAPKLSKIDFYDYFADLNSINSYAAGEDSLAGVQEKISAAMISFPLNIAKAKKSYILKLNPKDKPNLVENELYSMRLAHLCGIKTANVKLVRDKNKNMGLLVERFDRVANENQVLMLHQEDFCQVMNLYPSEKYRLSMSEIVNGVRPYLSAESPSILKIIRVFCFSYLLGNGDLHAKNMSLLTTASGLTDLSPAYDLLTTYIYGDHKMAAKLDGRDDNIKRNQVLSFGERHGLRKPACERMLNNLIRAFSKHHEILNQISMESKKWTHLQKMIIKRQRDLA